MGNWVLGAGCVVACGALLTLGAPSRAFAQDDEVGIPVGATPPATTVQDLNGAPVDLSAFPAETRLSHHKKCADLFNERITALGQEEKTKKK